MNIISKIFNPKNRNKLLPENHWSISIDNNLLTSIDWDNNVKTIDLNKIERFYIRTTNDGPWNCDIWYGIETKIQNLEIPQGTNGENQLLNFINSLNGFQMKGMNSTENKIFECWKKV